MPLIIGLSIAIFVLVILSGIFSSCDMVYATVNQLRLKKDMRKKNHRASKLALKFAENYNTTLTTVLFANNLVNIAASSLSAVLALELFKESSISTDIGSVIVELSLLLIILIFGEILPKVIGKAFSYPLSKLLAYPILVLKTLFFPIIFVLSHIGKLFAYPFIRKHKKAENISNEELQEIVETIEEEGVIDEDQGELLSNAIEFKDTQAHEVMTPRVDVFAIDIDDPIEEILKNEKLFVHSRIPVFKDTIDHIVGILPSKAVLKLMLAKEPIDIKSLIYPAISVPGSMGISEILKLMKSNKNHIVIVMDEYGGMDGLLTMEDILEELVGEMWDETDVVKEPYKKIKRSMYEVNGDMNIQDIFDIVGVDVPEDADYYTVAGFVLDKLSRFAKVGDKIKYENLTITVLEISEFTVEKVLIKVSKRKAK
ncbi:MAG: hemolysin family protein [Bacilli bacterium]|nr:hemolysin family protein [Bacilli bacterium]